MQKITGLVAFIVLVTIFIIVLYIETGFNFLPKSTTITIHPANTVNGIIINYTTTMQPLYPCNNYVLFANSSNTVYTGMCLLTSNSIGVWIASGNSGVVNLKIIGANNKTYISRNITYSCAAFFKNLTAPQQIYSIILTSGPGGGSCGPALVKFNSTVIPPKMVYDFVYNGNFTTGDFTGWNVTGAGFRIINVTYADNVGCYQGARWSNVPGPFFASTYTCGTQASPGNITSSAFTVTKPFLNFKIISPSNANLYVEILYNNSTAILAKYNTYNITVNSSASSNFRNATIPMTTLAGKAVRIKVVGGLATNTKQSFISVGGFYMSTRPTQNGNISNLTIYNTT